MGLYSKLLEIQKEVDAIGKDAKGYNFNYANPDSVLNKIRPLMNERGLMLKMEVGSVFTERVKNSKGKEETLYNVMFSFTWIDVESGEKELIAWAGSGINNDEQGLGSAMTYAERYFLLKQFHIPSSADDPDHLSNHRQKPAPTIESAPIPHRPAGKQRPDPGDAIKPDKPSDWDRKSRVAQLAWNDQFKTKYPVKEQ